MVATAAMIFATVIVNDMKIFRIDRGISGLTLSLASAQC